jgi:hypothetical protein
MLIIIAADPEDWIDLLLGGGIISVVPILLGVFLMKRRRKPPIPGTHADDERYGDSSDERRYR